VLPTLVLLAISLLLYGGPVPRLSEELYLPLVKKVADPNYLWSDWTFSGSFGEHWLFDQLFAPLAGVLTISQFGWFGRLVFWTAIAWLLLRIGRWIGLDPWTAVLALGLWLVANQSLIGGEWMIGTFESKTVAYVFFLGTLLAIFSERIPLALILLGLTATFHPAVGLWAAWGVGLALLVVPETRDPTLRWFWLAFLAAVPGIVGALGATGDTTNALDRFVVLQAIPYHTDPFFGGETFGSGQVVLRVLVVGGMLAFNLWAYRRSDRGLVQRFLAVFQVVAAVPFVLAFVARVLHIWSYLRLMPLRSFPLMVPLIFFFQAVRLTVAAWTARGVPRRRRRRSRRRAELGLAALCAIALVPTAPLLAAPRLVYRNLKSWTTTDEMASAFGWVRRHTPKSATCIIPVDRQDAFERTERAQVANWQAIPYDRLQEWRRRIDQLVGGPQYFEGNGWHGNLPDLRDAYNSLTVEQVRRVADRYDATCLVSETKYPLPLLHRQGGVNVYSLRPGAPAAQSSG
jgi:hypothetical protein